MAPGWPLASKPALSSRLSGPPSKADFIDPLLKHADGGAALASPEPDDIIRQPLSGIALFLKKFVPVVYALDPDG